MKPLKYFNKIKQKAPNSVKNSALKLELYYEWHYYFWAKWKHLSKKYGKGFSY